MKKKNMIVLSGLLLVLFIYSTGYVRENGKVETKYVYLETGNTVRDVINHPAFQGFGQFILPLDRGMYDEDMQLNRVASLLPYHSNINSDAVIDTINYLIEEVSEGKPIFYDFYNQQQKQEDSAKKSTGLFFFRGEPRAPFAIICPGGGFSYVGSVHEGFPYAIELSQKGYNAFVLQYRVGGSVKGLSRSGSCIILYF